MNKRLNGSTAIALVLSQTISLCVLVDRAAAQALPRKSGNQEYSEALSQGEKLCNQFKYKEAEPYFSQALKSNPRSVAALLGLSKVYRHQGKANQSYSLIKTAISIEPNNGLCYLESGKLFQKMQRYDRAIQDCKKAVGLAPNNSEAYYYLGWSQDLFGDKEAAKSLHKAVQLDPKNDRAWRLLAYALWRQDRYDEASQAMQSAIKLAPKNPQYQKELADILLAANKPKEAEAIYSGMKTTFPKNPVPYLGLAEIAFKQGNTKRQGELLRQATVIKPTSELAWLKLAQFYTEERRFDESIRCARIALGFKPKSAFNNNAMAIALINADKPQEAEPYLQKSVAFATDLQQKLRSQAVLVRLHFINNKNDRAMELAKEMYKQYPNEYWAISAKAWALMCFKKYDEGFALLQKGKKLYPKDQDLDQDYLAGLVSAERYDQAKALARKMLVKTPNDTSIWLHLMTVATKTHNKKDAEEAMKHTRGLKLSSYDAMEVGFGGMSVGADASSKESLKQAIEDNPANVDLIMNTRDPKAEKKSRSSF
ncbi:MAG: tetratricopeptide repeat protein [Candidatus Melainabacteria bacterium]|nr:tetratricopeptide repeat protein [Candidatus Melainabacteria bacterium]